MQKCPTLLQKDVFLKKDCLYLQVQAIVHVLAEDKHLCLLQRINQTQDNFTTDKQAEYTTKIKGTHIYHSFYFWKTSGI